MGQHLPGADHDIGRQPCQPGDFDAVAAIRLARFDLVEEDQLFAGLLGRHVQVEDALAGLGQGGQFVIVRREQGLRANLAKDILGDGPSNGQAIVRRGAAPDLVQQDQAALGGGVENLGRLGHLDHKGGTPLRDVVAGADAGEDAIDQRQRRRSRRHERADLCHHRDQGGLSQVGRLAAHVGTGDQGYQALVVVEMHVVLDESLAALFLQRALDHGVPSALDLDLAARGEARPRIVSLDCDLRQAAQHVDLCNRRRARPNPPGLLRHVSQ